MRTFFIRTGMAFLIWLSTNILATLFLAVIFMMQGYGLGGYDGSLIIFLFGLLFSSPVILLLVPSIYLLVKIPSRQGRIVHAVLHILLLCAIIVGIFMSSLTSWAMADGLVIILIPYVAAAEICYLLVTWRLIKNGEAWHTTNDIKN